MSENVIQIEDKREEVRPTINVSDIDFGKFADSKYINFESTSLIRWTIGYVFSEIRKGVHISKKEITENLHISKSILSRFENGSFQDQECLIEKNYGSFIATYLQENPHFYQEWCETKDEIKYALYKCSDALQIKRRYFESQLKNLKISADRIYDGSVSFTDRFEFLQSIESKQEEINKIDESLLFFDWFYEILKGIGTLVDQAQESDFE